ncbi:MAG: hypothetical protein ACK5SX_03975 [Sandaracinobacter sp.]
MLDDLRQICYVMFSLADADINRRLGELMQAISAAGGHSVRP